VSAPALRTRPVGAGRARRGLDALHHPRMHPVLAPLAQARRTLGHRATCG
jgi:hypothetical protein